MEKAENVFKGLGKVAAGFGVVLSVLDLGAAAINEDGDAFGKSLTGTVFGALAGAGFAIELSSGATSPHVAIGYYKDIASQQTAGSEMGSISGSSYNFSRIIFGTEEDDVKGLTGSQHKDYLFGGAGKDTLTGGKGDDYLEGGIGYDTYYIEDHDTISDSDMLGRLMFGKVARTATI